MDPNTINQMMQNPEMMKMAEEMIKTNPNMLSEMMKNMGNTNNPNSLSDMMKNMGNSDQPNPEELLKDKKFQFNDEIRTVNLSNETFNDQNGLVKNFNSETDRYEIFILDLDKSISVKEDNLVIN